jgi:hypothetical protein
MKYRLTAAVLLGALALLSAARTPPARSTTTLAAPTPLKVIKHVYSYGRLCTAMRRSVGPALLQIMSADHTIAASRPLFQGFAKDQSTGSQAGADMDVERLDQMVDPLVKNTRITEDLLNDPLYAQKAQEPQDKQLAKIRAYLAAVLEEQKKALDLVSGFVDTENMGELQAKGHEYDRSLNASSSTTANDPNMKPQATSPTAAPAPVLNAGLSHANDPGYQNDPRFRNTGSTVGYNPLDAFDRQMASYQQTIGHFETLASNEIVHAVPECAGRIQASPAASATP